MELSFWDILWRLLAAAVLAAPVGWERGKGDHAAGLRTQILIAVGSAAVVLVALRVIAGQPENDPHHSDPLRAIQGILGGIGLLAAGGIIRAEGGGVKGFTTASTVWAVCAIGIACGHGQFDIAAILVVLTLIATSLLIHVDPKDHQDSE